MPDVTLIDLSKYRLSKSVETLATARRDLNAGGNYLKPEILPRDFSKLIANASLIRNWSDYEDFYVCSIEDTRRLVSGAEEFLHSVSAYLQARYAE